MIMMIILIVLVVLIFLMIVKIFANMIMMVTVISDNDIIWGIITIIIMKMCLGHDYDNYYDNVFGNYHYNDYENYHKLTHVIARITLPRSLKWLKSKQLFGRPDFWFKL